MFLIGISDYRGTSGVDTKQYLGQKDEEEDDVQYLFFPPSPSFSSLILLLLLSFDSTNI